MIVFISKVIINGKYKFILCHQLVTDDTRKFLDHYKDHYCLRHHHHTGLSCYHLSCHHPCGRGMMTTNENERQN